MSVFPELDVLTDLRRSVRSLPRRPFETCMFVCGQHVLRTTGSLLESLVLMGVPTSHIAVLGKVYSTHGVTVGQLNDMGISCRPGSLPQALGAHAATVHEDVRQLWDYVSAKLSTLNVSTVCVIDDGGWCIESVPDDIVDRYAVVAVEQTTSGVWRLEARPPSFPVVDVATSAAKRILEPRLIAKALANRTDRYLQPQDCVAVVGCGNLGSAMARHMAAVGHQVVTFDLSDRQPTDAGIAQAHSLDEVCERADVVYGCSGVDWWADIPSDRDLRIRTCVSGSTGDVEFRSLLIGRCGDVCRDENAPCSNVRVRRRSGDMLIVRGGFPANFDNGPDSVPANEIQLTRGLLFGGMLQALFECNDIDSVCEWRQMLSPRIQRAVVSMWFAQGRVVPTPDADVFSDIDRIAMMSGGIRSHTKGSGRLDMFAAS